jgi:SAM-dependent methyltransferase
MTTADDRYGEDLAAIHAAGFTALAEAAARELLARLEPGSRVLELGCGDGTTADLLGQAGHRVHGIDSSPAMIELARRRAPHATLELASYADARLPGGCDAVLAVGEVLCFGDPGRGTDLGRLLARLAGALRPGGLLLLDLATPDRASACDRRTWREADGWAVLVDVSVAGGELFRRIVTYRDTGGGSFRRREETHRLALYRPADVLAALREAGFAARTLPRGYAGEPLPRGLVAYAARKRRGRETRDG